MSACNTMTTEEREVLELVKRKHELNDELRDVRRKIATKSKRLGADALPLTGIIDGTAVTISRPLYGGAQPQTKITRCVT